MTRERNDLNVEELVHRYLAGISALQLAKDLQVSRPTVMSRLIAAGVTPRSPQAANLLANRRPLPDTVGTGTITEMIDRYLHGESVYDLAAAFGVTRYVIEYRLKTRGLIRSPSERAHLVNTRLTFEQRRTRSEAARQAHHIGAHERQIAAWLTERGLNTTAQLPVGPYNIDIAVDGLLAIEVETSRNHPLAKSRSRDRRMDLVHSGWTVLYVWVTKAESLSETCADYVVTYLEELRSDPSLVGKHRVIRGAGERATTSGGQLYDWPLVPAPEGYFD